MGDENVNTAFRAHLCQKWIDLRQTKIKTSSGSFYTYLRIHFIDKNISFFGDIYLSVCLSVCLSHTFRSLYVGT